MNSGVVVYCGTLGTLGMPAADVGIPPTRRGGACGTPMPGGGCRVVGRVASTRCVVVGGLLVDWLTGARLAMLGPVIGGLQPGGVCVTPGGGGCSGIPGCQFGSQLDPSRAATPSLGCGTRGMLPSGRPAPAPTCGLPSEARRAAAPVVVGNGVREGCAFCAICAVLDGAADIVALASAMP